MAGQNSIIPALIGDIAGYLGLPGNTVSELLRKHIDGRTKAATDILLEEIRQGNAFPEEAADEIVPIVWRFIRYSMEGAARINLRLLSQCICGLNAQGALQASNFNRVASMLASLTFEEIQYLVSYERAKRDADERSLQDTKKEETRRRDIGDFLRKELIPSIFKNNLEFRATESALLRTGLFVGEPTLDGNLLMSDTELFRTVVSLTSFDDALTKERSTSCSA